jgi:glycine/D-amino acid oxidase-like deaminating enzyme/nitrite reductase/ring-hydroxylating ferredoxin subunit
VGTTSPYVTLDTTSAAESLWFEDAPVTGYRPLTGAVSADVAVVGGGIAGLSAALLLKRTGARVAVIEAAAVGTGVTGCTTAKASALQSTVYSAIESRHDLEKARVYAEASAAGVEQLASIVRDERIECELERRAAATYAADESERDEIEREAEAARKAGLPAELVESLELPFPVYGAVVLENQLQLHPVRYVQGLAAAVHGDGSSVFERSRVLRVSEGSPCTVVTAEGEVQADHVIVASHYPMLDRGLYFARLDAQRSYCVAVRLTTGMPPQTMAISAGTPTRSLRARGDRLIIGGEGHPAGSGEATPERFARLEAFAREHWQVDAVTNRWSAHDPIPYDHLPMVGAYRPGSTRLWVSTGFMKWGLASATFAAMILADRIGGKDNDWAETFSPNRLSLRSTHEVAKLGAKFAADLVRDRIRPPQSLSAERIAPGEARVVPDRFGRKGVYRALDGTLHAVSLRCTHLGCLLRFNAAERSWDCPCHGSRFAVDGTVLEGPAVHPLATRDP